MGSEARRLGELSDSLASLTPVEERKGRKVGSMGLQCSSLKVLAKEMENPQAKVVRRVLSSRKSLILVPLLTQSLAGPSVEMAQRW